MNDDEWDNTPMIQLRLQLHCRYCLTYRNQFNSTLSEVFLHVDDVYFNTTNNSKPPQPAWNIAQTGSLEWSPGSWKHLILTLSDLWQDINPADPLRVLILCAVQRDDPQNPQYIPDVFLYCCEDGNIDWPSILWGGKWESSPKWCIILPLRHANQYLIYTQAKLGCWGYCVQCQFSIPLS
jgi:hypothetical protein